MPKRCNPFGPPWLAVLLLAALLCLAGCGGEFWGGVGDWEPDELGAAPAPAAALMPKNA